MTNNPEDKSFFMGRVTASVSHELQNVLAIIRETAGLMEDFLMMGDSGQDLGERLANSLGSIKNQVNRGVNLTSNLNAFAHTADHQSITMDVRTTLARLLLLTERITRNKGFEIILTDGDTPTLSCDPVAFQSLFFLAIEALIDVLPSGQAIHVDVKSQEKGCMITFFCHNLNIVHDINKRLVDSAHWPTLEKACLRTQATLTHDQSGINLVF